MSAAPTEQAATAGEVLRSLAFYAAFYGGSLIFVLSALAVVPFSKNALQAVVLGWTRYHRDCVGALLGIRVRVEGEVPQGRVLVAMKHESFFEAIDLPGLLPRPAIFAKAELLRIPLWGLAGERYGLIGVERGEGAKALRAMRTAAVGHVAEGRVLAIFPEGTRVPHGTAPALQAGFAGLYKLLGLPVVPIAVDSGPLYHRRWKRAGTITIRIGEHIPAGLSRQDVEPRVHAAINVLNG